MEKDNITIGLTLLICLLALSSICWIANSQAKAQLNYMVRDQEVDFSQVAFAKEDTVLTVKIKGALDYFEVLFHKEQQRYKRALQYNYPKQYIMVWVILTSTVIAAFLNLIAINKGWANIGKPFRVALMFTVGIFMLFNLAGPVMQYDTQARSAYQGYNQASSLLRDVHYYGQSDGHLFLNDGVTAWPEFLSYMYGKIESLEKLGLNDGMSFMPGVKDLIERSKELTGPVSGRD